MTLQEGGGIPVLLVGSFPLQKVMIMDLLHWLRFR